MEEVFTQIILLRHAEKPEEGNELNAKGFERAAALPKLFETEPNLRAYGNPVALYAAAQEHNDDSVRSIQTLEPLSKYYGIEINKSFSKYQTKELIEDIFLNPIYRGRMVVICWSHKYIADIAKFLGAAKAPDSWDENVFNRFWLIKLEGKKVTQFLDLPQNLLTGDL